MKKVLVCGTLLGLLTSISFAQRGRTVGGLSGPTARIPKVGPVSPNATISPNSIGNGHDGILPNATTIGKTPKTVDPIATTDPTAKTVGTRTVTGPATVTLPDARPNPGPDR